MTIVVLAKQVPDPEALVEVRSGGKELEIEQKFATNLFDEFAIEEALRIREKHGGKVTVITLGGPKATELLRTALAMGADDVLFLEDPAFLEGDGYATALTLSKAVARQGADLVLCGRQAIDDDRAEVGPMVAEFLGLPHVGAVLKLDIGDGTAVAERAVEGGREVVEVTLPAVITAAKGLNEPRVPQVMGVMKAMRAQIPRVSPEDLGLAPSDIGKAGSKLKIERYFTRQKRAAVKLIEGTPEEQAAEAIRILAEVERVI
jgi:electron transfer flavoprotein beta subunit